MAFCVAQQVGYLLLCSYCSRKGRQNSCFCITQSKWINVKFLKIDLALQEIVLNFTRMVGVSISKTWNPTVTHVIASTDENGACKRTLKFLMGILEGKWILKLECKQSFLSIVVLMDGLLILCLIFYEVQITSSLRITLN